MNLILLGLFAPYPDVLTVSDVVSLIGGSEEEILCYLLSRVLPGLLIGGRWLIVKSDLFRFVVSGPGPETIRPMPSVPASRDEPHQRALPKEGDSCQCWPTMCCDIWVSPSPVH